MLISELLRAASKELNNSSTPYLDAEIILGHILSLRRECLIKCCFSGINHEQEVEFWNLLNKRKSGVSVAQIIGRKDFWKSSFLVSGDTLVPRPDSETMIEAFYSVYKNRRSLLKVADFGTGTGCLISSIAMEFVNLKGYGFEKNQQTSFIAKKNVVFNKLDNKIKILHQSWNNNHKVVNLDAIISNPPYIKRGDIYKLPKEISKYEPKMALDGGVTGMKAYEEIFRVSKKCLKKAGLIFLEIGDSQFKDVFAIANRKNFVLYNIFKDLSFKERIIVFKNL
jgi:release factor glutamine methyltransferase